MIRITLLSAAVLVFLLAADIPATSNALRSIEGAWNAKDPTDGSCLHLQITRVPRSGERVYSIDGSDRMAEAWCPGASRMRAIGVMQPEGTLLISAVHWCIPGGSELQYFRSDALVYDSNADIITTAEGATYKRQVLLGR